jgi:hypothetical protein
VVAVGVRGVVARYVARSGYGSKRLKEAQRRWQAAAVAVAEAVDAGVGIAQEHDDIEGGECVDLFVETVEKCQRQEARCFVAGRHRSGALFGLAEGKRYLERARTADRQRICLPTAATWCLC